MSHFPAFHPKLPLKYAVFFFIKLAWVYIRGNRMLGQFSKNIPADEKRHRFIIKGLYIDFSLIP